KPSPAPRPSLKQSVWHECSLFMALALVWFLVSPTQKLSAVNPPPDGSYPNGNTAEGDSALFHLTGGSDNTAVGAGALFSDTNGNWNTATGFQTLNSNTIGGLNTADGYRALLKNVDGAANTAT